jgi:hypothetical protein
VRRSDQTPALTQYRDALIREMILTERLRVKAVIVTVSLLVAVTTILHTVAPFVLDRISHGRFSLGPLYTVYVPFLLFEFMVLQLLDRRLAMHEDVPVVRRYLSALIETSLPTFVLYLHMNWMGSEQALGFAAPLAYFLFIVLSTLRLDFWLSTFTGFVAAIQLFVMAMLYHPAGFAEISAADLGFELIRHRARPRNQFVRPACVARGGRAIDGRRRGYIERHSPGRRHVRRFPQLYGRRAFAVAAGSRRPARRCVRGAGRHSRSPWRHREQVSG